MIIDLKRFVEKERPFWQDLERALDRIQAGTLDLSDLKESRRVLGLFQRACSDLSRVGQANAEPELRTYLETLVGRGYAEIHSAQTYVRRFRPVHWLLHTFPQTFRRQAWAFHLSSTLTLVGMIVGGLMLVLDVDGRRVALAPFQHVAMQTPSERVANEEKNYKENSHRISEHSGTFSAQLMANNIGVSIKAMAFGLTWGIGTVLILFYNGVILGAVCLDYMLDGQTVFMLGWLLPHGSFEIPAILIGGQAGLVIARALIGWGTRDGIRTRLRLIVPEVATLIGGVAVMLVWAGIVEAFFSQYHEPVLPYWVKIAFGSTELVTLAAFLILCGRNDKPRPASA
ncbi:MAG: stage II sporulation protein M [Verrucomicrobiaceae bacterium]|nr:stage II sporulation protein M [Verrucomicrobiaceae bacterium]